MKTSKETRGRKKESALRPSFVEPGKRTGVDGEMRLVTTGAGPKLKVRYKGKWYQSDLVDPTEATDANFVPKVWYDTGMTRATSGDQLVSLPAYVTKHNIIAVNFSISIGAHERVYFALGANQTNPVYTMYVFFNQKNTYVRIEIRPGASEVMNKQYTLAVFYKP